MEEKSRRRLGRYLFVIGKEVDQVRLGVGAQQVFARARVCGAGFHADDWITEDGEIRPATGGVRIINFWVGTLFVIVTEGGSQVAAG